MRSLESLLIPMTHAFSVFKSIGMYENDKTQKKKQIKRYLKTTKYIIRKNNYTKKIINSVTFYITSAIKL